MTIEEFIIIENTIIDCRRHIIETRLKENELGIIQSKQTFPVSNLNIQNQYIVDCINSKLKISNEELEDISHNWNINYALRPDSINEHFYTENDVAEAFRYGYKYSHL